jgi:hypothetical protein
MNVSADQVRAATRLAAAVITADTMPPLRLDESPGSHEVARRTRPAWTRLAWVGPLAAAAAVIIIVVGSLAAGSRLARPGHSSNPGARSSGASAGAYAGVPAYYVALGNPSLAVVRATATGATLVRITTRTPFAGVTGAADDRTFVLDAQRQVMGPTVLWPDQPAFYLLRLTASGTEKSYTRLALPALPKGTAVTGLALSPDGSKLAVEVDSGSAWPAGKLLEIRVYTLATGAFRTWFTNGSTDAEDPGGFTGSGVDGSESISWAADSRTLAFDLSNRSYIGVRVLDTAASGDNLIADSRLAVVLLAWKSQDPPSSGPPSTSEDDISQCVTDSIISLDGSAIVCGYTTNMGGHSTTTGFIRYSARTGKLTAVLGVSQFQGQAGGDISLYWVNSTGHILIGGVLTPSGVRVGVINGETFTPLPEITGLGGAAW